MIEKHQAGQIFEDRYEILQQLGSGGIGTVYKAKQIDCNRIVAVKILHDSVSQDEEFRARFLREAQTLNNLSHKNIVNIYQLGTSRAGELFIVMEYVEGSSLEAVLNSTGKLPTLDAIRITRDLALALAHVHSFNIVHRDLKPANVILSKVPEANTAKLIDFGLAREKSSKAQNLTSTGALIGTPHYMSPEQCRGEKADDFSDIYSLTLCLFEMLTGNRAFDADTAVGLMYKHLNEPAPRITPEQVDSFHPIINDVIQTGLAKQAEQRFKSMNDYAETLDSLLSVIQSKDATKSFSGPALNKKLLLVLPLLIILLGGAVLWKVREDEKARKILFEKAAISKRVRSPVNRTSRKRTRGTSTDPLEETPANIEVRALLSDQEQTKPTESAILMTKAHRIIEKNPTQVTIKNKLKVAYILGFNLEAMGFNTSAFTPANSIIAEVEKKGGFNSLPADAETYSDYLLLQLLSGRLYTNRLGITEGRSLAYQALDKALPLHSKGFKISPLVKRQLIDLFCLVQDYKPLESFLELDTDNETKCIIAFACMRHGQTAIAKKYIDKTLESTKGRTPSEQWMPLIGKTLLLIETGKEAEARKEIEELRFKSRGLHDPLHSTGLLAQLFAYAGKSTDCLRMLDQAMGQASSNSNFASSPFAIKCRLLKTTSPDQINAMLTEVLADQRLSKQQKATLLYLAGRNPNLESMQVLCFNLLLADLVRDNEKDFSRALRLYANRYLAYSLRRIDLPNASLAAYAKVMKEFELNGPAANDGEVIAYSSGAFSSSVYESAETLIETGKLKEAEKFLDDYSSSVALFENLAPLRSKLAIRMGKPEKAEEILRKVNRYQSALLIIQASIEYRNHRLIAQAVDRAEELLEKGNIGQTSRLEIRKAMKQIEDKNFINARVSLRKAKSTNVERVSIYQKIPSEIGLIALLEALCGLDRESAATEAAYYRVLSAQKSNL